MAEKLNRIAEWRKRRGLSQQALADRLGTHWVTLSKLERGRQRLTYPWMERIAAVLDIKIQDIVTGEKQIASVLIGGEIDETGRVSVFEDDALRRVGVYSSVFDDAYNDWFYISGDALWPYFKKGDMIGCTETKQPAEDFIGRFCIFLTNDNRYLVGLLANGSKPGLYNLQVGSGKPLSDLEGRVFAYVAHALFELPERPIINKVAQMDLKEAHEEALRDLRQRYKNNPNAI